MEAIEFSCSVCGKPTATERGLKIHMTRVHQMSSEAADIDPGPFDPETEEQKPIPIFDAEEASPEPTKKHWREKLWGSAEPKPKAPAERRPRKRRVSTEGVWMTLWTAAGLGLVRTGADIPVGNCLQFQAPIVGDILDEAIAGTFIDTLLQPIAGQGKRMKKVSSVLAMPILVGAMERSPGAAPILEPLLRQAIQEHLVAMAPIIKQRQKAEAEYRKALDELGFEPGEGEDAIDAILGSIFPMAPPMPETNGHGPVRGADGKFVKADA